MDIPVWIVWDLAAICVLAYFVYHCARRGFLRTVVSLAGYVASAALAGMFSPALAQTAYRSFVRDLLKSALTRRMEGVLESGVQAAGDVLEAVPAWMRSMIGSSAPSALPSAETAASAAETLIDAVLADPVISLLHGVCFLLLFWLFGLVARRVALLFTGVNRLPLIGMLNTFLGGVLGVLQGVLALYLAAVFVRLLFLFIADAPVFFSEEAIDAGFIFRFFFHMTRL